MKKKYLPQLIYNAPASWSIIRACEAEVLENISFKRPTMEIGCGDGSFSKVLFGSKNKIDVGIDIDEDELKRASSTGIYKQVKQCNATNLPFKNKSFNTIFSNGVLEHIPQIPLVLKESYRVLSNNGELIFTLPSKNLTQNLFGFNFLKSIGLSSTAVQYGDTFNKLFKHYNLFSEKEWGRILNKQRFRLVSYNYYNPKLTTQIHELLLPFAFPSKITKRFLNTQVLLRRVREILILSWLTPILLKLPVSNSTGKKQSSILIVAQKQ